MLPWIPLRGFYEVPHQLRNSLTVWMAFNVFSTFPGLHFYFLVKTWLVDSVLGLFCEDQCGEVVLLSIIISSLLLPFFFSAPISFPSLYIYLIFWGWLQHFLVKYYLLIGIIFCCLCLKLTGCLALVLCRYWLYRNWHFPLKFSSALNHVPDWNYKTLSMLSLEMRKKMRSLLSKGAASGKVNIFLHSA